MAFWCLADDRRRRWRRVGADADLEDDIEEDQLLRGEPGVDAVVGVVGAEEGLAAAVLGGDGHRIVLVRGYDPFSGAFDPSVVTDVDLLTELILDEDLGCFLDTGPVVGEGDLRKVEERGKALTDVFEGGRKGLEPSQ